MDAHLRTGHDSQVETSMPLYNCEIHCRTQSRKPHGVKTCSEAHPTASRALERTEKERCGFAISLGSAVLFSVSSRPAAGCGTANTASHPKHRGAVA